MDLISIIDNGTGINYNELPLAFCRHATSKISRFDDLYRLRTFGFRGEALASISAISHLTCLSQRQGEENAGKVTLEGGRLTSHSKEVTSFKQGTSLYIKDLFYNTPARLKFIKSKSSEKNAIQKIVESFIISNPEVSFSLKWDDNDKLIYKSCNDSHAQRVNQVFSKKNIANEELVKFTQEFEGHKVNGYLTPMSVRSHTGRKQFLFVNGRLFYDKQIHSLLCRIMDSRGWFQGSGSYCLFISAPPSQIDVNVHPSKTTIKFLKHSTLMSMISNSVKESLKPIAKQEEAFSHFGQKESTPLNIYNAQSFEFSDRVGHNISSGYEYSSINVRSDEKQFITNLHPILQIITFNEEQYIFHKVNFLKNVFSFVSKANIEESHFTPLLISEPLQNLSRNIDNKAIDLLSKFGLIVEKLDDEMTVVRAIFHRFTSNQATHLIKTLNNSNYKPQLITNVDFNLDNTLIEGLLQVDIISSKKSEFMRPLFSNEVEELFDTI